jgi:hypothetical protein
MKKILSESKFIWIFLFIAFLVSLVSADEKTDKVDKLFSRIPLSPQELLWP